MQRYRPHQQRRQEDWSLKTEQYKTVSRILREAEEIQRRAGEDKRRRIEIEVNSRGTTQSGSKRYEKSQANETQEGLKL